jgi:hypothetical protein
MKYNKKLQMTFHYISLPFIFLAGNMIVRGYDTVDVPNKLFLTIGYSSFGISVILEYFSFLFGNGWHLVAKKEGVTFETNSLVFGKDDFTGDLFLEYKNRPFKKSKIMRCYTLRGNKKELVKIGLALKKWPELKESLEFHGIEIKNS